MTAGTGWCRRLRCDRFPNIAVWAERRGASTKPLQDFLRRGAILGISAQQDHAQIVPLPGHGERQFARRHGTLFLLVEHHAKRFTSEWKPAGQFLVQHYADGISIAGRRNRIERPINAPRPALIPRQLCNDRIGKASSRRTLRCLVWFYQTPSTRDASCRWQPFRLHHRKSGIACDRRHPAIGGHSDK